MASSLVAHAKAASKAAYCPYSHFPVGAVVLTRNGKTYSACNVENASYGLTICAERSAVVQAVADGVRTIIAVAIYTPTEQPTAPCGACRQVLSEFGPEALVYCGCDGEHVIQTTVSELLPHAFGPKALAR